ncbi:MAG: hypothetical protein EAZ89_13930, partial [Bacteroidetes bacterium]
MRALYYPLFTCLLLSSLLLKAQNDWENTAVFRIGTEPVHATFTPCATESEALAAWPVSSGRVLSLNGDWQFRFLTHPSQVPEGFYETDYPDEDWAFIPVPSCWHRQGYGIPMYRNIIMPFPAKPPLIATDTNETGLYRHRFSLPAQWADNEVFMRFEGVESAFYLWVNGRKVGYHEDSFTPAEFRITSFLSPGENTLTVEVIRWSDGSYLEDQDYWRLGGIFRNVSLVARPQAYIRDVEVLTQPDSLYRDANVSTRVWIRNEGEANDSIALKIKILSPSGEWLAEHRRTLRLPPKGQDQELHIDTLLQQVALWSSETPNLYRLCLSLEKDGQTLEA